MFSFVGEPHAHDDGEEPHAHDPEFNGVLYFVPVQASRRVPRAGEGPRWRRAATSTRCRGDEEFSILDPNGYILAFGGPRTVVSEVRETWGRYTAAFAAEGEKAEDRDSIRKLFELCAFPSGARVARRRDRCRVQRLRLRARRRRVSPATRPTRCCSRRATAGRSASAAETEPALVESWAESLPVPGRHAGRRGRAPRAAPVR